MGYEIAERELDRFCWLMVSWRNRFAPPDETAESCIVHHEDEAESNDDVEVTDYTRGREYGYHCGMVVAFDEMMEQFYGTGINVMARANRYVHVNREHGMEFRTGDEPDFYRAVERGAEVKVMQSPLYDEIEIEQIGEADYVPRGAE